jgi:hypothetical protein
MRSDKFKQREEQAIESGQLLIYWTEHALIRANERFEDGVPVIEPNRLMLKQGAQTEIGGEFRIRRRNVIYVCKRAEHLVVVVTVIPAKTDEMLTS